MQSSPTPVNLQAGRGIVFGGFWGGTILRLFIAFWIFLSFSAFINAIFIIRRAIIDRLVPIEQWNNSWATLNRGAFVIRRTCGFSAWDAADYQDVSLVSERFIHTAGNIFFRLVISLIQVHIPLRFIVWLWLRTSWFGRKTASITVLCPTSRGLYFILEILKYIIKFRISQWPRKMPLFPSEAIILFKVDLI